MELHENTEKQERALLVAVDTGSYDVEASLAELYELTKTAGAEPFGAMTQKRPAYETATCVGSGMIQEIADICQKQEIDLLIFDCELSPTQIRNIEDITNVRVIDRTMLILDIFAANGFELTELGRPDRRPAQLWQVAPTATRPGGTVGIIASITRPFCDDCDRTRLTAAAIAELGIQVGTSLFAVIKATAITLEAR